MYFAMFYGKYILFYTLRFFKKNNVNNVPEKFAKQQFYVCALRKGRIWWAQNSNKVLVKTLKIDAIIDSRSNIKLLFKEQKKNNWYRIFFKIRYCLFFNENILHFTLYLTKKISLYWWSKKEQKLFKCWKKNYTLVLFMMVKS